MFRLPQTLTATALTSSLLLACGTGTTPSDSDLPVEGNSAGLGKADAVELALTPVSADIDIDRLSDGGKAIITSADSWEDYFGTPAPADVDFDHEWVAFFGAGMRNTGGYSAEILSLTLLEQQGGLILETLHQSPGADCLVTQAFTWPHTVVKFDTPDPAPTFAVSDHENEVYSCSPSNDDLLVELADSRSRWDQAVAAQGESYTYTSDFASFFGFSSQTTVVVDDGTVTERHFKSQFGANNDIWSEFGADVGSHAQGAAPVLIDALYDECASDVLTQDPDENFITLTFDQEGFLQTCTYFPKNCADDCSFGPTISSITF